MGIYAKRRTLEQYRSTEQDRLEALDDQQLYSIMVRRTAGNGPDAFLSAVYVDRGQQSIGQTIFRVTFTDTDLQPATKPFDSQIANGYWQPSQDLQLNSRNFSFRSREGYFLPYEDEFDLELMIATKALTREQATT